MLKRILGMAVAGVLMTAGAANANLLTDGTFDTALTIKDGGTVAEYTANAWYTQGTAGWNQCWRQNATDAVAEYGFGNVYKKSLVQVIPMPAAGDYTLSFDVNQSVKPQWGTYAYAGKLTSASDVPTNTPGAAARWFEFDNGALTTGWETRSQAFTITADDVANFGYLFVAFVGDGGVNGVVSTRLDNVAVNGAAVPEPASLSLLGLGALAMLRRRR